MLGFPAPSKASCQQLVKAYFYWDVLLGEKIVWRKILSFPQANNGREWGERSNTRRRQKNAVGRLS